MRLFLLVLFSSSAAASDHNHCDAFWTSTDHQVSREIKLQDIASIVKFTYRQATIRRRLNRLRSEIELFLRGAHPTSQVTKSLKSQIGDYRHLSRAERREKFSGIEAAVVNEFEQFFTHILPSAEQLQGEIEAMTQALETKVNVMTREELQLSFRERWALKALRKELARIHMQQDDLKAAQLPLELSRRFIQGRHTVPIADPLSDAVTPAQAEDPALALWLYVTAFNSLEGTHSFEHCSYFFKQWEALPPDEKFQEVETWYEYVRKIRSTIPARLRSALDS